MRTFRFAVLIAFGLLLAPRHSAAQSVPVPPDGGSTIAPLVNENPPAQSFAVSQPAMNMVGLVAVASRMVFFHLGIVPTVPDLRPMFTMRRTSFFGTLRKSR